MGGSTSLVLSGLAFGVSLLSAVAAVGSWIAAKRQLEAAEAAKQAETLLALFSFLHQPEQHAARNKLRDLSTSGIDREAARSVSSAFDFAGVFVNHRLVDRDMFLDYWGDFLRFLGRRLTPFLDEPLFDERTGRQYWRNFNSLLDSATTSLRPAANAGT